MIIDDDREFLDELRETLSLAGYEMISVNDANAAAATALKTKPDVILIDLKMPGKSGFQVADEVTRLSGLQDVPIIAMSGYFKDEYSPFMNVRGIRKCLKKPFNPLDVIVEIEAVL
jgi:DNA-binding response OmpR family regulator